MDKKRNNSDKKSKGNGREKLSLRTHSHTFMLNDEENRFFMRYLEKYKIDNKARFIRQMLICAMLTKTEEDHPTLF